MTEENKEELGIAPVLVEDEMRKSYLDYAMSVIVSRALPDVRDGLKPVHRRILWSMHENGYDHSKPFRKSARIVGDVMGKYHPHGDSAIYESMVRMAQPFSMGLPLIASQGNFGSMDGDKAAAMRYTEAKLAQSAQALVDDLDKDTVDFRPNYDETCDEPVVLPARFPNLLVNGSAGIAVGMATNIPPHNLGEVLTATIAMIDNPEITMDELLMIVPGPDFPTGGVILGRGGSRSALSTGRGSVILRGKCEIEEVKGKSVIIVSEVPYQVNKAEMISKIAELVKEKVIEGISDLRDESDRDGVRVVIELKKDAHPDVVLNQLYKYTSLQSSFAVNSLALYNGRPMVMNLADSLRAFIEFREEVIRRRTIFDLNKARDRAHIVVGLAIAVANIDLVIEMIKKAANPTEAKEKLMAMKWNATDVERLIALVDEPDRKVVDGTYQLSEAQAKGILDLKLNRLTGLERDKLHDECIELCSVIKDLLDILASKERVYSIMRDECMEIKEKFAVPRRTQIDDAEFDADIEDLIPRQDMVVTVTNTGYIKRVPVNTYRAQHRGGKGRSGMSTREEDYVVNLFVANTHVPLLFFSSNGIVYKMKTYRLPEGSPQSLGKALINLLPLDRGEKITTVLPLPEKEEDGEGLSMMFATASGNVRRNRLADFYRVNANGKIAMKLDEGDKLIGVVLCDETQDILLSAKGGKCVRFPVTDVRVFESRASTGVRGMKLGDGDEIMSMAVLNHVKADTEVRDEYLKVSSLKRRDGEDFVFPTDSSISEEVFNQMEAEEDFILTLTDKGYGKQTSAYEYRITSRGAQGVTNIDLSKKDASVVASCIALPNTDVMLVTDAGKLIRTPLSSIRTAGRNTMGVIVFRLADDERVVSVSLVEEYKEETEGEQNEENMDGDIVASDNNGGQSNE